MKEKNVLGVLLFIVALVGFSLYGLLSGSVSVQLLVNLDMITLYARIVLAVVLLTYLFAPVIRTYTAKNLLYTCGVLMMILGIGSLTSSVFMSYTASYILLLDSLLLVEAGILSIILGADLSAKRTRHVARSFSYVLSALTTNQPKPQVIKPNSVPVKMTKPSRSMS